MTFDDILAQVLDLLQRQGRVSYSALRRRFEIDDAYLDDLKDELLFAHPVGDEDGRGLVWTGDQGSPPTVSRPASGSPLSADQEPEPLSYTPSYLAEKILTSRSVLEGERKQVTVLFADIKDSTELIRDLDPEEAQKLLDPAIHIMMEAVHRFEGTVNQVLGDGIMSIFGAPIAHEDHAARACYAALAMQVAMRDYTEEVRRQKGLELRIRVGLNSGEVVVRTIGNDLHMDYSAVGPTTHLAARMEQLATPGSIRLSAATLRLVEGLVRVDALGLVPVKGMSEPVQVFELTGASTVRRRLQAAVARGLTKFVGREMEIEALNQALELAGTGQGQVVAAVGEAGVGKSRLVYEFVHSHRTQGWLVLESASVSYGKATPYFPVVDLLKRYVHVEEGDDGRTIRAKVTGQLLTLDETLQETLPALLSLLDALPEDSPFLQLDPPLRRQRTLDGLKRILLRESQVQPLVLVFEDLHWHDSESQAFLDSLVESLSMAPVLLLVNYRPEYSHNWGDKTYYTQLRLDPFPPESAHEFLEALLGDNASLEPLKKLLIERTEGNPFFLEESVRALVETQVLAGESGAYRLVHALPTIQAPATVQAVLAARIDRLPPDEKRLLQTAGVIGHEVPLVLLQAIADCSEEALHRSLTQLQRAEFLYETRLFPEREYTFKHALTHEVSYSSLLQERRRVLHARIVTVLEELSADPLPEQVDRLAHHALRGEVWAKALAYCWQAGEKALARSAYREAVGYFEQALSALQHLPETRVTHEQAIDLRLALRTVLLPSGDFGRTLAYLHEAESLVAALDDSRRLGQVSRFLAIHFYFMGAYNQAIAAAQRVLALAMASGEVVLQALANQTLGMTFQIQGDYRHWTDPTTLEFLGLLVEQVPTTALYTLLTCRLAFQPSWSHRSYLTEITVNRLSRQQVERMAQHVAGGKRLPVAIIEQLVDKTDGVPLYVEEMTKSILEAGYLKETNEHYELTGSLSSLAIPATLQDSLMARLDRLVTAKAVAQYASVIGRQFTYELLQAASELDGATLQRELGRLVEAELVYQQGLPPQATYLFKHALVQESAYHSLLRGTRQGYHRRIAQVLAERFLDTAATQPELLAHHYNTEAGINEQAVGYWQKAGEHAFQHSAHVEAINYFTKGLDVLTTLLETSERMHHELILQIALGTSLMVTKGYASLEVERVYQRVQQLCQDNTVEEPLLSQVLRGLITFHVIRAEIQTAHKLGEQLLHLAQRSQNATLMLWSHLALGQSFFCRGELAPACKHLEAGWALYDPHKRRSPRATQDLGVTMLAYAALALWLRGYPTQAWHRQEEAMRLAHALAHPFSLAFGWHLAAVLHRFRRVPVGVQACAEALITLSAEQTFAQYLAIDTMQQGWACAVQGQGKEGVRQIRQGIIAYQDTGGELFRPYWLVLLVEASRCADQLEEGLTVLTEALTLVNKTEERWYEAELYRLKGELLLQQSFENHSKAESCVQKAIAIAQNQSAKSWELRAATSLAKLWQSQGKRDDARELLGEIYGWFTEGFDTADLKDAKMLLDELS